MAERELALLIVGIAIGVVGSIFAISIQRALALRADHNRLDDALTQRRARQLRDRLQVATDKSLSELDLEHVYAGLLSENGLEIETMKDRAAAQITPLIEEVQTKPDRQDPISHAPGRAAYDLEA